MLVLGLGYRTKNSIDISHSLLTFCFQQVALFRPRRPGLAIVVTPGGESWHLFPSIVYGINLILAFVFLSFERRERFHQHLPSSNTTIYGS